jgi:tRNA (guanine10-N2)-methyltransferase
MLIYDPFCGTGSFLYTCSHFGALTFGNLLRNVTDPQDLISVASKFISQSNQIDGRNIRGKGGRSIKSNFEQYGISSNYLDAMTFDLTQNPIRKDVYFDAIVCDRTLFLPSL